MNAFKMAACGVLIALTFRSMINLVIYPLMGAELQIISLNASNLSMQLFMLRVLYPEECKEYWRIITRKPGN